MLRQHVLVAILVVQVCRVAAAQPATVQAVAPRAVRDGRVVQRQPAGAFGGGVYLVAWSDGSRQADRPTADIYCGRIDPYTGAAMDPAGIPVCSAPDLQQWPAVAFDGTNFLIVWQDMRSGRDLDVYAARVSPSGRVIDPDGFLVAGGPWNQARPSVAFAAGRYLVVWMDARLYPVYGVYAARVLPDVSVLDPGGFAVDAEAEDKVAKVRPPTDRWMGDRDYWWQPLASRYLPVAASDGKTCLVAYLREYPFAGSGRPRPTAIVVDPADGRATAGPVQLPGGAYSALAACPTANGWAVVLADHAEGWDLAPRIAVVRLDGRLATTDAFARPHSGEPDRLPQERLDKSLAPGDAQVLNPGKGAVAFWRAAAAWDGRRIVAAQDFGWRLRKDPNDITYVIAVNILLPGAAAFAEPRFAVAASTRGADQAVANPVLVAGPPGQVLLLYEHDFATDRQAIEARVFRCGP